MWRPCAPHALAMDLAGDGGALLVRTCRREGRKEARGSWRGETGAVQIETFTRSLQYHYYHYKVITRSCNRTNQIMRYLARNYEARYEACNATVYP